MIKIAISKEALEPMPQEVFTGHIHVIDRLDLVRPAIRALKKHKIIGFDTETRPAFHRGESHNISLVQLSSNDDAFLFRVNRIGMPKELCELLEDDTITKVGLSINNDFLMMSKSYDCFEPKGFEDIQRIAPNYCIADASLQKIHAILFDKRISKSQRLSNWEAPELSASQMSYAAIDAWSCLKIYNFLMSGRFKPETSKYIIPDEPEIDETE